MADSVRKRRLNVLLRERHGRERREGLGVLLDSLSAQYGDAQWDIVQPGQADDILSAVRRDIAEARARGAMESSSFGSGLDLDRWVSAWTQDHFNGGRVIIVFKDSQYLGVVRCDSILIRGAGYRLLQFDGDDVIITSEARDTGLILTRVVDDGIEKLSAESWKVG